MPLYGTLSKKAHVAVQVVRAHESDVEPLAWCSQRSRSFSASSLWRLSQLLQLRAHRISSSLRCTVSTVGTGPFRTTRR